MSSDGMWEFNRSDLAAVLKVAASTVRWDRPVGLFVSDGQQVALVTDNDRIVVKQVIPTGPLFPGTEIAVGVPVVVFSKIVGAMAGDRVSVSVDDGRFVLDDDTAAATVAALEVPAIDLGVMALGETATTSMKRSKLNTITKAVSRVVSHGDGPTDGVRVTRTTAETTFVATDRYRLHAVTTSGLFGGGDPMTVPLEGFTAALAAIHSPMVDVASTERGLVLMSPTAVVAAREIPGEFPAWHGVVRMPHHEEIEATVAFSGPELRSTAKRVQAAVGDDMLTLTLDPDGGTVTVSGRSVDGSISVVVPATVSGGATTVIFSQVHLVDVLGCLDSDATMTVCASARPVLFHSADGTFRAAVAPSRSPVG